MFSIIIPVFNQQDITYECLNSIKENTKDFEIILVDNGSIPAIEDNTIKIIRNDKNLGYPVAVNQGIGEARGDIIILLNNDVIATENWAEYLKVHLSNYDIVGPVTNYSAGVQRVSISYYGDYPELLKKSRLHYEENMGKSRVVTFVIGYCQMFFKSIIEKVGTFDESLWPCSGEDIDFCLRANRMGYKIGVAEDVYIHHVGSQTLNSMQEKGIIDYSELCKRNDKHLSDRWGEGFWQKQVV